MSLLAQDERLTRRVGAIALGVIGAAIVFFVFLYDRIELGTHVRIKVYLAQSAGLHEHAPLVVAGQPVGFIETIEPVTHGTSATLAGGVGVAITVALDGDAAWKVPAAAEIFVASRGPLSDKYLEVAPPHGEPGRSVHGGDELRGIDPPSLDNVMQHTWANMTTYTRGLGGAAGVASLGAMAQQARTTLAQLRATIDVLAPKASALGAQIDRVRTHVAASDPVAKLEATIAKAKALSDQLTPLLAMLDDLSARLARGEGSLGRLMNDPEFPEDAKELGKIMKRQPWKIIARPKD